MRRRIDAARPKIKAEALGDLPIQYLLLLDRIAAPQRPGLHPARLRHRPAGDLRQLRPQFLKKRRDLTRLRPALIEIEQRIIRLVFVAKQIRLLARDAEQLFQMRREPGEVRRLARFDPHRFRVGADFTLLLHQFLRQLRRLIEVPSQLTHVRRLRRVLRPLRLGFLQQFPRSLGNQQPMRLASQIGKLPRPMLQRLLGHVGFLIPTQHRSG